MQRKEVIMIDFKLSQSEEKFAKIIWENEPIASGELVKLCENNLNWKKSTTYTVLKNLCDKGIFQNINSIVSSRIDKNELESLQSRGFVEDAFGGSLPKFITAFIGGKKLSAHQAEELKKLIDEHLER